MTTVKCLRCVILVFFAAATSRGLLADEPSSEEATASHPAVVQTIEQWQQRRKALDTLKIVIEGELTEEIRPGQTDEEGRKLIPGVVKLPVKTTWYLDLKHGRYRREELNVAYNPVDGNRTPIFDVSLWDGEHFKMIHLRLQDLQKEEGPTVSRGHFSGDAKKSAFLCINDHPLFYSLGYIKWSDKNFSDILTLKLNDGAFLRVRDWKQGQTAPFVLVRRGRKPGIIDELTVDPEKGGAITHFRSSVDPESKTFYFGPQVHTIDTKFQQTEFGWFPKSWTLQMGEPPNVQSVDTHKVVELKFNPKLDRSLFQIEEEEDQEPPPKK